jgi:histidine ammonia-lyase
MGMTAAIKLQRIVQNTRNVLAIEALAAAQALDFVAPLKTTKLLQKVHDEIRAVSPAIQEDRVLTRDFAVAAELVRSGKLAKAARS